MVIGSYIVIILFSVICAIIASYGIWIWLVGYMLHTWNFIIINPTKITTAVIVFAIIIAVLIIGWITGLKKINKYNIAKLID